MLTTALTGLLFVNPIFDPLLKRILLIASLLLIVAAGATIGLRNLLFTPLHIPEGQEYLYVKSNWNFDSVQHTLSESGIVHHPRRFELLAKRLGYADPIRPGRYSLKDAGNLKGLIRMLKGGHQKPLRITINSLGTIQSLAGLAGQKFEADSLAFLRPLIDSAWLDSLGFRRETALCLVIPNTYEYYWNSVPKAFYLRLLKEQQKFWTESRKRRANAKNLTPDEVYTLASIVEKETQKKDEMAIVAGVYLNRLTKGMKLQADPTVIFAIGNPDIKRVRGILDYPSPYNTYLHLGLPPGPICIPSIAAIDGVLQAADHDYLYFCASADFSGYHVFAKTYSEHQRNAAKYHKALNKMGIRR